MGYRQRRACGCGPVSRPLRAREFEVQDRRFINAGKDAGNAQMVGPDTGAVDGGYCGAIPGTIESRDHLLWAGSMEPALKGTVSVQ